MGAAASTVNIDDLNSALQTASSEELKDHVGRFSAEDRAKILKALQTEPSGVVEEVDTEEMTKGKKEMEKFERTAAAAAARIALRQQAKEAKEANALGGQIPAAGSIMLPGAGGDDPRDAGLAVRQMLLGQASSPSSPAPLPFLDFARPAGAIAPAADGFRVPKYPMHVVSRETLLGLDVSEGLPFHEALKERGLLYLVCPRNDEDKRLWLQSGAGMQQNPFAGHFTVERIRASGDDKGVGGSDSVVAAHRNFLNVSHQWLRPSCDVNAAHPDSATHEKLKALQRHLTAHPSLKFVWMDWVSIPQRDLKLQADAINSLPYYFSVSTSTLILCRTLADLTDRYEGYLSRGWCLLELLTTRLPRLDASELWYAPGYGSDGKSAYGEGWRGSVTAIETGGGEDGDEQGAAKSRPFALSDFVDAGSPLDGNFTNPNDKKPIAELLERYVQAFDAFGALLRPLRDRASSWDEYVELPEAERRVQTYQAREHFDNPAAFADFLQADKPLVEGLRASVTTHNRGLGA